MAKKTPQQEEQERKAALESRIDSIEKFKKTDAYKFFMAQLQTMMSEEHRLGWENEDAKAADMKTAQNRWHAMNECKRIFDIPKTELDELTSERQKEDSDKPLLPAAEGNVVDLKAANGNGKEASEEEKEPFEDQVPPSKRAKK